MARIENIYEQAILVLFYLTVFNFAVIYTGPVGNNTINSEYDTSSQTVPSNQSAYISPIPATEGKSTTRQEQSDTTEPSLIGSSAVSQVNSITQHRQTTRSPKSPIHQRGEFTLMDEGGDICLKAQFVIHFKIYYKSKLRDQNEPSIELPTRARIDGRCDEESAVLTLHWKEDKYILEFTFKMISNEHQPNQWAAERIQFTYDQRDNHDFDGVVNPKLCVVHSDEHKTYFDTKLGMSRYCSTEQDITLKSDDAKEHVVMEITKLHLQPFSLKNDSFSQASHCDLHKNNNTASLVVGLTLAIFIVIVISGYAVGRKTGYITERPGYSTME